MDKFSSLGAFFGVLFAAHIFLVLTWFSQTTVFLLRYFTLGHSVLVLGYSYMVAVILCAFVGGKLPGLLRRL